MRLLHSLAKTHASFDDPNLVSHAGLVPVMALAHRAGLGDLVAEHVRPGGECGVNAHLKIPCQLPGMSAAADSIDDVDLPRHGVLLNQRGTAARRPSPDRSPHSDRPAPISGMRTLARRSVKPQLTASVVRGHRNRPPH